MKKKEAPTVLPICLVFPNPDQPRKVFDPAKIEELAMSIKQYGVIEPIVVTPREGGYMIIAGERRWRASYLAGLEKVQVKVIEADNALVEELALLENIQRENLNSIEEAVAFKSLLDRGWTKEKLAEKMGFKQIWRIDERLSLLSLDDQFKKLVVKGEMTNSQAFEMSRVSFGNQTVVYRKIMAGELGTYNKLRAFVDGLIAVERQGNIFVLSSLTPSEEESLKDLEGLMKAVERLLKATNNRERFAHYRKAAFHSDITASRFDLVIQQFMRLRKTVSEGEGIKSAMNEAM